MTMIGAKEEADGTQPVFRIPSWADFLFYYSTVPGFYSWRNTTQGSWFIQALVQVLNRYGKEKRGNNGEIIPPMDLLSMTSIINRRVAYDYESNVPGDTEFDKRKQVPCLSHTLTRTIYFPSKI